MNNRITDLNLSYPYYQFKSIPDYAKIGLRGARCTIQEWLGKDNTLMVVHYDGERVLFGDKISFIENYSVELSQSSLSVVKDLSNYILFCQYIAEEKSITILEMFDTYTRKFKVVDHPLTAKILHRGAFNKALLTSSCVVRFLDPNIPRYKYVAI